MADVDLSFCFGMDTSFGACEAWMVVWDDSSWIISELDGCEAFSEAPSIDELDFEDLLGQWKRM